jgi:PTH1 family peptidyl-tRNA hydrolase
MSDIFDLFKQIEVKKEVGSSASGYEYIIVGLGNPGKEYEKTRHNAGFMFVDRLGERNNFSVTNSKFKGLVGEVVINSHRCLVLKPETYMNHSGESVKQAADFYKIPPEHIIVVFDDISLDVGKMRIRKTGSAGGHNGIKSVIAYLSSDKFPRIKIGVGQKPFPEYDLAAWVTGEMPKEDFAVFKETVNKACDALPYILDGKFDEAMCKFN